MITIVVVEALATISLLLASTLDNTGHHDGLNNQSISSFRDQAKILRQAIQETKMTMHEIQEDLELKERLFIGYQHNGQSNDVPF